MTDQTTSTAVDVPDADFREGDTAFITYVTGPSTQCLLAEWTQGAWQAGAHRYDHEHVTSTELVTARRDLHTGALTDAITQSRTALAAEQAAAAALRTAITAAVSA